MSIHCVGTVRVWRTCILTFYAMHQAHIYCQSVHMKMMPLHRDGWCCYDKLSGMNPSSFTWQHRLDNFFFLSYNVFVIFWLGWRSYFYELSLCRNNTLPLSLSHFHSPFLFSPSSPSLSSFPRLSFFLSRIILHSCSILFSFLLFSSLFLCSFFSLPLVLPSHLNTTQWLRQQRQRQRQEQW